MCVAICWMSSVGSSLKFIALEKLLSWCVQEVILGEFALRMMVSRE